MDKLPQKNPPSPQPTHNLPARRSFPNAVAPPRRTAVAAEAEEGISPRKILAAIRYWWIWALPGGIVLATAASLIVYALFDPQYRAAAWIRIEEQTPYLAFQPKATGKLQGFVQTQIELLRSPMVLVPVSAVPELGALPEASGWDNLSEWLRRKIEIAAVGTSELYTVSFTCSKPKTAALVVNAILDSYFLLRTREHSQRIAKVVMILEGERDGRLQAVERLRQDVRQLAKEITGQDPFQSGAQSPSPETKTLDNLANRLIFTEVEESILGAKVQALESLDPAQRASVPEGLVEQAVATNPQVRKAVEALAFRKSQLNQLSAVSKHGMEGRMYQGVAKIMAQEEKALEGLKESLRAQARFGLEVERASRLDEELVLLRSALETRRLTRHLLEERYEAELKSMKQYSGDTVIFKFKQEELAREEKVLDLISERIVHLQTEQGAPSRVWEMRRAIVPIAAVTNWPYMNMLLAFVVGLCAPFGLAILKEQIAARISDVDVVERQAHLAVLGEIACLPTRRPGTARLGQREQRAVHLFEESVDAMRTNLLLGPHANGLRSLAVTSAVNQEGKTSVVVQLATSIARAYRVRVLIIDGDLRDPGVHNVFEIPGEPGLTNVLAGECSLRDAIAVSWVEGLDVLPAGVLRGSPHALLGNGRWESFFKQIPPQYRYVIIDTPPVLAASEALVLTRGADAVLICAMRDVTRLPQLKKATQRIASTGAKMAGLVLNGIPASHYPSHYGTYSYMSNWMKNK